MPPIAKTESCFAVLEAAVNRDLLMAVSQRGPGPVPAGRKFIRAFGENLFDVSAEA
jgi:hypothetical protein